MALGKNLITGRFNAAQTPIMKRVRKPRFVDNAVRHGEYTKVQAGFKVVAPTQNDFLPTHDRKYTLAEEGDTIRILHNPSDGHRYTGAIYSDLDKVTTSSALPPLFVGGVNSDQALVPSSIESSTKGTRYRLENLKGRGLNQIGFTDRTARIVQKVGIGLRTSDLAIRVSKGTTSSLNSVISPNPSATFVAQDFYGTDAVTALRFLSRHDGYSSRGDAFGNLYYVHQKKHGREHIISQNMVTEGSVKEVSENTPNRVVVRGRNRANNDDNVVQVDDFGTQSKSVNEIPGGIFSPTAITKASARGIGRRFLSIAKQATGGETLRGVFHASSIQPGDVVSYNTRTGGERKIVLSTQNDLINRKSQLALNSVESSLEDVIQRFQESDISSSLNTNSERNRQFSTEEFSTAFGFKMKVSWRLDVRKLASRTSGMTLGPRRATIHGRRELKSTGTLINSGAGYAVGTTSFTTDGTAASSSFAVGDWVYRSNGNKLGKVASRTTTNVTVAIASPDLVADNEELFLLAITTMAESLNSNLKIGMNKGTYDSRRRG